MEHWLGLDNIYKLTNRKNVRTKLMIILEQYYLGTIATVTYDDFSLQDQVNSMYVMIQLPKMNVALTVVHDLF